ncbi:MAG: sugar ABC transporter permease, partial [Treponema sp.]|nr:sugar ABC transporter permease [Treponema sp.]
MVSKSGFSKYMKKNWQYYAMLLVPVIYYIVIRYVPMLGNIIAFRRYRAGHSIFGDEWSGLKYFKQFIGDKTFWRAFKNTLVLNITYLL